ncbi:MAG: hypothetical protein KC547_11760 [Anaerolineae bacterium]|nr:hypothetical protein [Anaerolineae bacterium]MCA9909416.1 hypothetical protein [Anaerolineae bacterium]
MQTQTPDILPEYHFLMIAPGLGAEWLFDTARAYFDRFRPTIIPDLGFVQLVPTDRRIAVTTIARRDVAPTLGVQLGQLRPNALYDPIVHDTAPEVREVLDQRAATNQPFGVPLALPTQDTSSLLPSIPTPMVPTQPGEGWVTVTPTPSPTPTQPASEPTQPGATIPPVQPTPGSLIGG